MLEINEKLLEKLLRKYENDNSIQVKKFCHENACGKGENFMSIVHRVTIEGHKTENNNAIDYKMKLIIKKPYKSEVMQSTFYTNEIFNNEVIAYNEIIPALKKHFKYSLPIPRCLFASKELIVLEDLSAEGYKMQKDKISMSLEQCAATLKELAIIHSASIILKHYKGNNVKNLSKKIVDIFQADHTIFHDLIKTNLSVALTILKTSEQTEKIIKATEILENLRHGIYQRICELIAKNKETSVFNHGDCWRNNILFKTNDDGINVKFVDLQVMRYTSVAADINYFLCINLEPEKKRENLNMLLDVYLSSLHDCITKHDLNIDIQQYSKEWLVAEMKIFAIFGFVCSLWIAPAFYLNKDLFVDLETIKPEEMDACFHEEFVLKNMTSALKEKIISLTLEFTNNYSF